jgi:hypothetical protein
MHRSHPVLVADSCLAGARAVIAIALLRTGGAGRGLVVVVVFAASSSCD